MSSIGVGIIGAGSVSRTVHVPGFRRCPGAALVAVADPDPAAAAATGIPRVHATAEGLLADPGVEAVVVAVPNAFHHEVTLAALAAGKHVLCEKPLGVDLPQARAMLAAARAARRVHMTAYTYQFAPAYRALSHLVAAGELGPVRTVRAAYLMAPAAHTRGWRSSRHLAGSGVLADLGSHLVQLVRLLAGEVERVAAVDRRFAEPERSDVDVEDWIAFLAELAGGAAGTFEISRASRGRGAGIGEEMTIEVYGADGTAVFALQDPWALRVLLGPDARDPEGPLKRRLVPEALLAAPGSPRDVRADDPRWGYRYDQAWAFVQGIAAGAATPSFEDGARGQAVLDAVLRARDARAWVDVADVETGH